MKSQQMQQTRQSIRRGDAESVLTNLPQFIQEDVPEMQPPSVCQADMETDEPTPLMSERLAQVREAVGGFRLDNSRLDRALQNLGQICEELDTAAASFIPERRMGEPAEVVAKAPSHREEEVVQELTDHLSLGRADTASTITLLNMLRALSAHTPFKTLVCKDLPTLMEVVWQKMDNPWVSQRRGKPLDHS